MNILFFLVHPAKFHFHRIQINTLKEKGHNVDVFITGKDILEELVKAEGWDYINLFPHGRKIENIPIYASAGINFFKTITRLLKYTKHKKYDLFIGDLLTVIGLIKKVPTLFFTDDDLSPVPAQAVFFKTTKYLIAPEITDLGKYNKKKIPYYGYKALAHLHPNHFKPEWEKINKDLKNGSPYFLIRCVKLKATHDIGKSGLNDDVLRHLIEILKDKGNILISAERKLPSDLEKYQLKINKNDIGHYIYFAKLLIGDSTTMSSEAAVLGTPAIEFDDYFYDYAQMIELQDKYKLVYGVDHAHPDKLFRKVEEFINTPNLKEEFRKRSRKLIADKIDVSAFLIWFMENYPQSFSITSKKPDYQYKFK